jgi:Flp pilus assembly protein TadG
MAKEHVVTNSKPRTRARMVRRWHRDERGNVGIMFGATITMLLTAVGVAIDYSSQSTESTKMWAAADSAALAAARQLGADFPTRKAVAEKEYFANLTAQGISAADQGTVAVTPEGTMGVRVAGTRDHKNTLMGIFGKPTSTIKAMSVANYGGLGEVEIAMVLDNTGSMKNDMAALRTAANSFADTVFSAAGTPGAVKVALVPYSASVNVGAKNMSMLHMDTGANSKHHGQALRHRQSGYIKDCEWNPGGGGGGGGGPGKDPGDGKNESSLDLPFRTFAEAAREVMGIKPAFAQATVTPNTDLATATGKTDIVKPPYTKADTPVFVPTGFIHDWHPCGLYNPPKVSHFDLFNRVKGAKWKGCVEARPEPYDVTDTPPNPSNADTLFVPYFWPDEADDPTKVGGWWKAFANDYTADGPSPAGWMANHSSWERTANLFKYDGKQTATLVEVAPDTSGPNKSCGQELTPLTSDKSKIIGEIAKMRHWNGGGTITSEGLMWGWRVLSPDPPFTEGKPYDKVKKYLVLMTDGENMIVGADKDGPVMTHYSAYGYLRDGRFPSESYADMYKHLDNRMELACENIKKTGITIMTVLFRVTDKDVIKRMEKCATVPPMAYQAKDENALKSAFDKIAAEVSRLKLTK